MNLTIEKTILTLFSLTICLSIGAPLILSGIGLIDQSHEIVEIETLIQQLETEIRFLEANPDETIRLDVYIPSQCSIQAEGNQLDVVYTFQNQVNTREIISTRIIMLEGGSKTGFRLLTGYVSDNIIYLAIL